MNRMTLTLLALALCAGVLTAGRTARGANSDFATEVWDASADLNSSGLYNDPNAVLGKPTTRFLDPANPPDERVKLVESAYNVNPAGEKVITTLSEGSFITVKFDHQVENDPNNPFGIDFLVFGNQRYNSGGGYVNDNTNMNNLTISGSHMERVLVSVSQTGADGDWYTYDTGPYADDHAFPTQAYQWDATKAEWTDTEMDWTKPVDPALADTLLAGGMSAAAAIALYDGSAGGTGFDLAESGYDWIQYIKVEAYMYTYTNSEGEIVQYYSEGEIDGFSDVAALPEPATVGLLAVGALALLRRKRNGR